jgi:SAM-dependent methyltransferase
MGAARRGYRAVGLSWDERNQAVAMSRARILRLADVTFPTCDVRRLDERSELKGVFDVAVCSENIEHIIGDRKLFIDMYACLKPGGRLLLATPNFLYHPMARGERGPFREIEDGAHVRRGYSASMLRELCDEAGFRVEEIGYVSHTCSQLVTRLHRALSAVLGRNVGWFVTLPFRLLPPLLDPWLGRWLGRILGWPGYSITLSAYKPRFAARGDAANSAVQREEKANAP